MRNLTFVSIFVLEGENCKFPLLMFYAYGYSAYLYVTVAFGRKTAQKSLQKCKKMRDLNFDLNIWPWGKKFDLKVKFQNSSFLHFCVWSFCIFLYNCSLVGGKLCNKFTKKVKNAVFWSLTSIFDLEVTKSKCKIISNTHLWF